MMIRCLTLASLLACVSACAHAQPETVLAEGGVARASVVVSADASEHVRQSAQVLAEYLSRMSGGAFEVTTGDGSTGIAIGISGQLPAAPTLPDDPSPAAREAYLLRSHESGVYVICASGLAVRHAVWDLLYRLGHRQFFPGETWEVVPRSADLRLSVDALEKPDYLARRIWVGYGAWDYNVQTLDQWYERNRAKSDFVLNTGHAYDNIIRRNKAVFDAHPEYYGLYKGERNSSKICIGNPEVRALVVPYALNFFADNPGADSVSVDPSDGGKWCECDLCAALGTVSDRALTLANEVSAALEASHPGKYVAMYAYNQHAPPPTITARPRVIINVATSFLKGMSVLDVIEGWKSKGVAQFGIREYYSVNTWDRDLPGRARGARLGYIARTIPQFHALGAVFMSSESSDNWGPNGLGYYIAQRLLWDVDEAKRVNELRADFLDKCFGDAREPMDRFYALINGDTSPRLSADLVGRMYRLLDEAGSRTSDPAVRRRLDALVLYTRYVELFDAYQRARGEERQAAFEQVIRHAYRMRTTQMVHTKALYRDLVGRDKSVSIPEEARWQKPEPGNPWKSSEPWSREELDAIIAAGIAANPVVSFEPVTFSTDLIPIDGLIESEAPALKTSDTGRGTQVFYTWFDQPGATLELRVTGGLIAHYRDRGDARVELLKVGSDTVVDQGASAPDGVERTVVLRAAEAGLHVVRVSDGSDMTRVIWPDGVKWTLRAGPDVANRTSGRSSGYFYVPRGTKVIGGYAAAAGGAIHDPSGEVVFKIENAPNFFEVPVPEGQDGQFWSFRDCPGAIHLLTVPPYVARSPGELLLPREVVEGE